MNIDELERKLDELNNKKLLEESEDKKTLNFKWKDRKFNRLAKKARKKPEYVLVEYLRNNRTIDFLLCKVISGNIIVIDNKGHTLNRKAIWIRGKYTWYIVPEWDTEPISIRRKPIGFSTDDHPVLMKMVLGAVQKKEMTQETKKWIWIILLLAGAAFLGYIFFFAK